MRQVTGSTNVPIAADTWEDAQPPVPRDADVIGFAFGGGRRGVRGAICWGMQRKQCTLGTSMIYPTTQGAERGSLAWSEAEHGGCLKCG